MLLLVTIFGLIIPALNLAETTKGRRDYDYCSPTLCPGGKKHIACNNTDNFSPNCGENVQLLPMDDKLKLHILKLHNSFRNEIANGQVSPYGTARRMSVLSWDFELEYLAKLHVKQCKLTHDQCRNTRKFRFVGQNVGETHNIERDSLSIKKIVEAWCEEYRNANETFITRYQPHPEGKKLDHFTAIVGDRAVKLGCACIRFSDKANKDVTFIMTCNYSSTNFRTIRVYSVGQPASGCKTGPSPRFPALCTYKEKTLINPKLGLLQ